MIVSGWKCIIFALVFLQLANASGLYKTADNVTIFTANTIVSTIKSSSTLWFVEYYLEWCGHCQDFVPTYVELANDISDWFPVLKVAVINCADDENNKFCTEQGVDGFPTLRLYNPKSDVSANHGRTIKSDRNVNALRSSLLALVETNIDLIQWHYDRPKPIFKPAMYNFVVGKLFKDRQKETKYIAFVFEKSSSTLGKEIILDMSSCSNIIVRRIVTDSRDGVELQRKLRLRSHAPFVIVAVNNGTFFPLNRLLLKTRRSFVNQLKKLPGVGEEKNVLASLSPAIKQESAFSVDFRTVDRGRVYMADIESGLRYMLTKEVPSGKSISDEKLQALKGILKLFADVGKHFPASSTTIELLKDLSEWVETKKHIYVSDWLKRIDQKHAHSFLPPAINLWVGCHPSVTNLRGYPCSLWTIFHALSVAVTRSKLDRQRFPTAMYEYVTKFFGCLECRNNFRKEIVDLPYRPTDDADDVILWLWTMHNKVNERLHGSSSEDPAFPKLQYPPASLCPRCWNGNRLEWRKKEVALFLTRLYSPEHISWDYLNLTGNPLNQKSWKSVVGDSAESLLDGEHRPELNENEIFHPRRLGHGRRFHHVEPVETGFSVLTGLDWSLCFFVWLISLAAVVFLVAVVARKTIWRRKFKSGKMKA